MNKAVVLIVTLTMTSLAMAEERFIGLHVAPTIGFIDSTQKMVDGLINIGASSAKAEQDTASIGVGIVGGRWFNDNVGLETGYRYFGNVDGSASLCLPTCSTLTYNYDASAFHIALLAGAHLGHGRLYGKAGAFSAETTSKWEWPAVSKSSSGTTRSTGLLVGMGYDVYFSDSWLGRFGVDFYNKVEFQDVWDGAIERNNLYSAVLGVLYSF